MIKTAFLTAVLGVAFAYGAPRPETSTYVDGNVTALKPNTGGTLVFSDDSSMKFRTGVSEVTVPYASIQKAELGATQTHGHDSPSIKPLTFIKLLEHKTETQLLTVGFKNGLGEQQTMTLELAKNSAGSVLATIEERTGKSADDLAGKPAPKSVAATAKEDSTKSANAWWGDSFWKTNRNQSQWDSSANASNTGK